MPHCPIAPLPHCPIASLKQDPRRQNPPGVERCPDGAHLIEAHIAIELPQQRLLYRGATDAVFGQWAAPEYGDLATEFQNGFTTGPDVGV